ncbi:MAG: hypothetical protein JXL81_13010, partial [Deltaproteobacteria bacterium]|nr:hypothetical protein [Deltaproteobacteria bacterium]
MKKINHEKNITSARIDNSCCSPDTDGTNPGLYKSGCMICGAPLIYYWENKESTCFYCSRTLQANAGCPAGHFVCDRCHSANAIEIIKNVCLNSRETDMVKLMQTTRSHPLFGMHGPEHHSMVPAVILTALKNSGHEISDDEIITAIERGKTVCGGACAFLGACGAATGVGIAVSLVLKADPYDGAKRQAVQQSVHRVLAKIASYKAPRCCQRDSWIAFRESAAIMYKITGKSLTVDIFECEQFPDNKEC